MVCVFLWFFFNGLKKIRRINSQPKLQISDEEIDHVYRTFAKSHRQKLMGYYQLKSMLGPLIEGLILLDRLQWLAEKQDIVKDAYLVKMFDAVVSPRCYSIVA